MTTVGFVGIGRIGSLLAASVLRAGFPLVVHDLDRSSCEPLLGQGAQWAASPREAAEAADLVITCLPSPAAVTAVVAGPDGVLAGFPAGGAWIDMSTNDPHEARRLAALATEHGVASLEAPVTGGVHRAESGEITVLIGGDESAFRQWLPVLEAIGGEVFHVGPVGSASTLKVITNMLAFVHVVAAGEAMMLVRQAGLDPARAYEAIRASSGNSFVHETETPLMLDGTYDIGFTMDLACKDLAFARALGEELAVPLALADTVGDAFVLARERYGGDAWSTMVVRLLEDAVGTTIRQSAMPD